LYRPGELEEKIVSYHIHSNSSNIPILVSALLLRRKRMGQVDVAFIDKCSRSLYVLEVKKFIAPSLHQLDRLRKSGDFLSQILKLNTRLKLTTIKV